MKNLLIAFFAAALAGCASWTPAQQRTAKRVGTVLVLGAAAAMAAAHSGGGTHEKQFPCGCTPPPGVK